MGAGPYLGECSGSRRFAQRRWRGALDTVRLRIFVSKFPRFIALPFAVCWKICIFLPGCAGAAENGKAWLCSPPAPLRPTVSRVTPAILGMRSCLLSRNLPSRKAGPPFAAQFSLCPERESWWTRKITCGWPAGAPSSVLPMISKFNCDPTKVKSRCARLALRLLRFRSESPPRREAARSFAPPRAHSVRTPGFPAGDRMV